MKKLNIEGLLNAFLGLFVVLTPVLLPVCQGMLELANGNKVPMRCHWTAQAEMLLGALILIAGLIQAFAANPDARRALSQMVTFLGLAVVLTPIFIIPTCTNPDMACNVGTKPALLILGGLTILAGLIGSRPSRRQPDALAA